MPRGEQCLDVDAPVVVKQSAASEDHEIAVANGGDDRGHIGKANRVDVERRRSGGRISGNDRESRTVDDRTRVGQNSLENHLVTGVAEAVVAGDHHAPACKRL